GFILTLDLVFTPVIRAPDGIDNTYVFRTALRLLGQVLPSEIVEKILLLAVLTLSGIGAHRLAALTYPKDLEGFGKYIAGALYMVNPYTYSRFMAGQYTVLLGYALLPFFVRGLLRFMAHPSLRHVLFLSGWTILISIVSLHTLGLALLITAIALVVYVWKYRSERAQIAALMRHGLIGIGLVIGASIYWLVPLLRGQGATAEAINQFGFSHQLAFETAGNGWLGKLFNVLKLQGFWAEARGLYVLPKHHVPFTRIIFVIIWALVIIGGTTLWKRKRNFTLIFVMSGAVAAIIATGVFGTWLSAHVPLIAGYREPHKFAGIVALSFAIFAGLGAEAFIRRLKNRNGEMAASTAVGIMMTLPLALTPTMFWGFAGQLQPRHYPAEWFLVNRRLNQDHNDFKVLFLPWHLYMHMPFAGRVIASPANNFFVKPIIASDDPEFCGISPTNPDAAKHQISRQILASASQRSDLGAQLAPFDIKYILLANTSDVQAYDYLDHQQDLQLLEDTPTIKLYRN
ncbi:MAG: hypothetical protein ACRD4B_03035, partial [Acidobacteriota bacterium]